MRPKAGEVWIYHDKKKEFDSYSIKETNIKCVFFDDNYLNIPYPIHWFDDKNLWVKADTINKKIWDILYATNSYS